MTMTQTLTSTTPATQFDIHVTTQVYENYNTDCVGAPYWKAKGGQTVVITGFAHAMSSGDALHVSLNAAAERVVEAFRGRIEADNDWFQESIIDWELVAVGTPTEDEKLSMEFDGRIDYPSTRIALTDDERAALAL